MSQFPRRVLIDADVSWDPHANGAERSTFTRHGTVADIEPGSALEAAYGNENLSAVIPVAERGQGDTLSKACVSN